MKLPGWWTVAACLLAAGCGGTESGPSRYRLSGTVTFDGQPVPAGTIYLEPASGPAGSARIIDGKYDTNDGKGIVGGPHTVMIEGFDGRGANPGEPGTPLFKPFRAKEDLPAESSTKDFAIPASAAKGLVISKDPA
jgi:hypothetical protein